MTQAAAPISLDGKHPIMTQEYAVYTPAMDEMLECIGNWIDQRITGGYIYGPSRYGKSRTVKWYLRDVLYERFGPHFPLVIWIRPSKSFAEKEFWNQLLAASKFHFFNPLRMMKTAVARFLFKQQLITLARAARQNYVVLVIDEAHDLTLTELKWLLGIQNDLDDEGYRFSLFSIASHQIAYKPDYLAKTGNAHIVARFYPVGTRFRGILDEVELGYVLNGYDIDSEWPSNSNMSYLQYCAPEDFAAGHRLSLHMTEIWKAIESQFGEEFTYRNNKIPTGVPMEHIARATEQWLQQLASGMPWDKVVATKNLSQIIERTGLREHLRIVSIKV